VVAGGGRGVERGARLAHRRGELERGELGDDVAGAHASAFLHLDACKLAADFGREPDLGCAHDAGEGCRRLGAQHEIAAGTGRGEDET
jgi:hypothetical protein